MRVVINCQSFVKPNSTGIGRYAFNLVRSLTEINSPHDYFLYYRKGLLDFKKKLPKFGSKRFVPARDCFGGGPAKYLRADGVYHLPSPGSIGHLPGKAVVTIHDLIHKTHPDSHTPSAVALSESFIKEAVDRADKLICVSQSTADDLKRFYSVEDSRIRVVLNGLDKKLFKPLAKEEAFAGKNFILFVGTLEPRKNLITLLRAFDLFRGRHDTGTKLIVVGGRGWKMDALQGELSKTKYRSEIEFLGRVEDAELRRLYSTCAVYANPSFYEGFGFPVAEAMASGAPVLASDISAFREIAGQSAVYADPHNFEEWADKLGLLLGDPCLRQRMSSSAVLESEKFSFEKTARKTLDIYEECLK